MSDDSEFEREQVRRGFPEVRVIDLPRDPMHYAAVVRDCPAFERLALSAEDRERTALYKRRRPFSPANDLGK